MWEKVRAEEISIHYFSPDGNCPLMNVVFHRWLVCSIPRSSSTKCCLSPKVVLQWWCIQPNVIFNLRSSFNWRLSSIFGCLHILLIDAPWWSRDSYPFTPFQNSLCVGFHQWCVINQNIRLSWNWPNNLGRNVVTDAEEIFSHNHSLFWLLHL